MEAFLVSAIFLLLLLAATYTWRKRQSHSAPAELSSPTPNATLTEWASPRGLFDNPETHATLALAETERQAVELRVTLLARAATGELEVLTEAYAQGGVELYQQALGELVACVCEDEAALQRLVRQITQAGHWRANTSLAETLLARWQSAPERYALGELLHIAALSDDAAVFQRTAEAALAAWRAGRLGWASAHNLHALIESEYWILAPAARQSGAGFVLKRMLVAARRELAAAAPAASSS